MKTREIIDDTDDEEHEAWSYDQITEGLDQHDESLGDNQPWVGLTKIVVPTERDKQQLLKAFHYIHNLHEIDSSFVAVNLLMHLYEAPDLIQVENVEENTL